ncbi:hypothetical protein NNQ28_01005 [Cronobacter dublinensis]|nr:hypothetical protein [Cronobacter dublinensis]WNY83028.1 hypothetical protein NNQ28_01005 [Cronobacter dublinensis]
MSTTRWATSAAQRTRTDASWPAFATALVTCWRCSCATAGRRTHKILWRYGEKDPETIRFDWQGLQLAGEQSDREPDHYVQYLTVSKDGA